MKHFSLIIILIISSYTITAQDINYKTLEDIHYVSEEDLKDEYKKERCVLDIYYPINKKNFSTIVWFHGGGLKAGNKYIPEQLKNRGHAIVAVNYRFSPKVKSPAYIEDAAASVAWVFNNIAKYGGDKSKIFVSGHSAGGYLSSMIALDKKYLRKHNIDANDIASVIPFSGHAITHFTIREERGIEGTRAIIDEMAPLYHVRNDASPYLMITGNREIELLGRYEENAYMLRMMKIIGHSDSRLFELDGYDHGMEEGAFPLLLKEVKRIENK